MCNQAVNDFVERVLSRTDVEDKRVLEVGSCDVNGSVRPYIETLNPSEYLGVDIEPGPRVDRIVNCEQLCENVGGDWDVVVTSEMLEHVKDWRLCMAQLSAAITPGGLLLITTRSPGFPYHAHPIDCWRYTIPQMTTILKRMGFTVLVIEDDPIDPGVFVLARKPGDDWPAFAKAGAPMLEAVLMNLHVEQMPQFS